MKLTEGEQSKANWFAPFIPLRKSNKGSFWNVIK